MDGLAPQFNEPLGLLLLPDGDVLVADSVNHALRRVRLADGAVTTVAGTGAQLRDRVAPGATAAELSTPWDLAWWDGRVVVAMAGNHQLWTWDPTTGATAAWAGTTNEGLRDGPPAEAFFAQPSGLAVGRRRAVGGRRRDVRAARGAGGAGRHRRRAGPVRLRPPRRARR